MSAEAAARQAIFARFADAVEHDTTPPGLDEGATICSAHGLYPPDAYAEEYLREALLVYLGAGWGVGPEARWRDRLRVRFAILWERLGR